MPVTTLQVTPSGSIDHRISRATASVAGGENDPGYYYTSNFGSTSTQFGWTGKASDSPVHALVRLPISGIAQYASVSGAVLRFFTDAVASLATSGSIALLVRDGIWNMPSGTTGWSKAPLFDFGIRLQTSGGASDIIGVTASGTATTNNVPLKSDKAFGAGNTYGDVAATTAAQTILMPASGPQDMQRAQFRLARSNSPGGSCRVKIFATVANDGSDDRPTGAALATSNDVTNNSLTGFGAGGSLATFDFPTPLTLSYNTRYAVVIDVDDVGTATAFVRVLAAVSGDPITYASGIASLGFRNRYAFHSISYTHYGRLPFHLGFGGVARTAPFSTPVVRAFPIVAAVGQIVDIDVTSLVQDWVDAGSYAADYIAFSVTNVSGDAGGTPRLFSFDNAHLIITEGTNHLLSGAISGEAQLGAPCGIKRGYLGPLSCEAQIGPFAGLIRGCAGLLSGEAQLGPSASVQHAYRVALSGEAQLGPGAMVSRGLASTLSGEAQLGPSAMLQRGMGAGLVVEAQLGSALTALRGLIAALSGQAILAGRIHECGWFRPRSSDWFSSRADDWFAPRSDGWFDPPEDC